MDAFARQRVEVDRERRGQRLAFTRAHFSDFPLVQRHGTHDLYVEMAHFHDTLTGLPHRRKHIRDEAVQGDTFRQLGPEVRRLGLQLIVR